MNPSAAPTRAVGSCLSASPLRPAYSPSPADAHEDESSAARATPSLAPRLHRTPDQRKRYRFRELLEYRRGGHWFYHGAFRRASSMAPHREHVVTPPFYFIKFGIIPPASAHCSRIFWGVYRVYR